jgi:hypothetical protein
MAPGASIADPVAHRDAAAPRGVPWLRRHALAIVAVAALAAVASAWVLSGSSCSSAGSAAGGAEATAMQEYVGGHWVRFTAARPLTAAQWSVVDAYANFSSAVLAVYATGSVAPLATVVAPGSDVVAMFRRDLARGTRPAALYSSATVEQVSISGCRARLVLELSYPDGRRLHYVSSWFRPFYRTAQTHRLAVRSAHRPAVGDLASPQFAPWQFVGDNRVGGVAAPCGI